MKKFIKKIGVGISNGWKYFEGHKRNIGLIAGFVLRGVTIISPGLLPLATVAYIENGIDIFLLGGLLDHARRTRTGKELAGRASNLLIKK